eukprot:2034393-Rhodomonas_salina.1
MGAERGRAELHQAGGQGGGLGRELPDVLDDEALQPALQPRDLRPDHDHQLLRHRHGARGPAPQRGGQVRAAGPGGDAREPCGGAEREQDPAQEVRGHAAAGAGLRDREPARERGPGDDAGEDEGDGGGDRRQDHHRQPDCQGHRDHPRGLHADRDPGVGALLCDGGAERAEHHVRVLAGGVPARVQPVTAALEEGRHHRLARHQRHRPPHPLRLLVHMHRAVRAAQAAVLVPDD